MNICKYLAAIVMAMSLTNCATVIRGSKTNLNIVTIPPEAQVTTNLAIKSERVKAKQLKKHLALGLFSEEQINQMIGDNYGCVSTPCKMKLSRRAKLDLTISLDGYHDAALSVKSGYGRSGVGVSGVSSAAGATGGYLVTYGVFTAVAQLGTALLSAITAGATSAATAGANAGVSAAATGVAGVVGVGMIGVDLATGSMKNLKPNPIYLVLIPDTEPLPEANLSVEESEAAAITLLEKFSSGMPDDIDAPAPSTTAGQK